MLGFSLPVWAVNITLYCGGTAQELIFCKETTRAWAERNGHTVRVIRTPRTTNQQYRQYLRQFERADSRIDIYPVDVIWTGLLARYFIDLSNYIPPEEIQQHFPVIIANNKVNGRLIAMPKITDAGLLYYRKDLLSKYGARVPETWSELTATAQYIQTEERKAGNDLFWGYVFQGEAYEGLTCNALEWIAAYGGGNLIEADGAISVNNLQAITALQQAANWVGNISPRIVTIFREDEARLAFMRGNVVFMRNWPSAWSLLESASSSAVAGKVGIAPLPKGGSHGRHASTLGGWQLAVSKFSKHPKEAAELVRYLTSLSVQKRRALELSHAPTIMRLYDDPEILQANPIFASLPPILRSAVARPSSQAGEHYWDVSRAFWTAVHEILQGKTSATDGMAALQQELEQIKAGGW